MNDKLSAFLDGDLDEPASGRLLDAMRRDPSLASTWEAYCTIGDAIRGEQSGSSDFTARVMACLEDSPRCWRRAHCLRGTAGRHGPAH